MDKAGKGACATKARLGTALGAAVVVDGIRAIMTRGQLGMTKAGCLQDQGKFGCDCTRSGL